MNTFSKTALRFTLVAGLSIAAVACGMETSDEDGSSELLGEVASAQAKDTTSTPSGPCTVISGSNKGKKGTYNEDGDCAGDWGMSECKNQDGTDSGKCQAGHIRVIVRPPVWGGGSSGVIGFTSGISAAP